MSARQIPLDFSAGLCLYCGEEERCEIFEVWADGNFMLDTCCEGMRDAVSEHLAEDPKAAAKWMAGELRLEELCGRSLRRVIDDSGHLMLDWNLEVVPVSQAVAKAFVLEHHRHCPPPAGWRFGAGVRNGGQLVGVVMVGRPVARAIDQHQVVEVNRLCVRTDIPQGMTWNACSLLYGWAAREAKRRGFKRVITYTMADEPGTTLKAAGWAVDGTVRPKSWSTPARPRLAKSARIAKTRWCRELAAA